MFLNGPINDPTPYPAGEIACGYEASEGNGGNYVVAWFDYDFP